MARQIETWQRRNLPSNVPAPIVPSGRSGLAEGLEVASREMGRYAQGQERIEGAKIQKKKEDDNAKATKSFAESSMIINMGIQDLELNAKPGAEGHRQAVTKLFDEEQKRVSEGIADPEILDQMNNKFYAMKAQLIPNAMAFEAHSGIEKRVADFQDGFDASRNLVASNPSQFPLQLKNLRDGIDGMQVPDARKDKLRKEVEQQLASSALGADINNNPSWTLSALKSGKWDEYVDPDQKIGFINQAESELKRRDAEAKSAAREARLEAQLDLQLMADDARANALATGQYNGQYEAGIRAAYRDKPQRAQKMIEQYRADVSIGQNNVVFRTMPNGERAEAINKLKPQDGSPTYADDMRVYQAAVEADQNIKSALDKDPAGYVLQTSAVVKSYWERVDSAKDPAEEEFFVKEAVEATKQAQRDMGLEEWQIKTLSADQAASYSAILTNPAATADEITTTIASVDAAHGGAGIAELVKAGANITSFGISFADKPQDANWRGRLVEWGKISEEDQKKMMSALDFKPDDIDRALASEMADFVQTMPGGTAARYIASAKAVMSYNMAKRGMSPEKAAADATQIFRDKYTVSGSYRVPSQWNADTISYGLADVIGNIRQLNIGGAGSSDKTLPQEFLTEELQDYIESGNYSWRNASSPDGNKEIGVMLMIDDLNPVMVNGKPFVLSWEDIASRGRGTSRLAGRLTGWAPQ